MESESDSFILEKFKEFLSSLKSSSLEGSEEAVDSLFKSALELEKIFLQEEKMRLNELLCKNYPNFNFNKPVDFLIENIIKSEQFDEELTLYAINKYTVLYSKEDLFKLLKGLLSEVQLRSHLFNLIEESPDVDLDLYRLNNFLCDIMNSSDLKSKVQNALKTESLVFLKSLQHAEVLTAQTLINEMIDCLESQTDLKLWFLLMREDTIHTLLDLCVTYSQILKAILKFFDNFANEVESIYDEELSIQYSHVNVDFEDFIKILQLFLSNESINKVVCDFLDGKTLTDKNFLFWVDVKSCL